MIEGNFKDVSLPALLQLLCFEVSKSFRINISSVSAIPQDAHDGQRGYIQIRKGWVVAAQFGILEGEDAICEFQTWTQGNFHAEQVPAQSDGDRNLSFDFQPNFSFIQDCAVLAENNVGLNSELTGSQFFGSPEWKQLVNEHPLDKDCFSVLAWLREGRKMRQALREFGFDLVRATNILATLVQTRSVQVIRAGSGNDEPADSIFRQNVLPTTGGQQEAAAKLAREAAKALESATDVGDEAFMSKSYKAAGQGDAKTQVKGALTDSQTNSYSLDTQSRSSMEARLRAKKNSGVLSVSDMQSVSEKSGKPAAETSSRLGAMSNDGNPVQEKKPKPDLFSVLQSHVGKVVPDLGAPSSPQNSGQVTASTHNLPSLRQAILKTDKPDLLKPDYAETETEAVSGASQSDPRETATGAEMTVDEAIMAATTYAWAAPAENSPMSVNWPKNIPTNTFQNLPAQKRPTPSSEPVANSAPFLVDAASNGPKATALPRIKGTDSGVEHGTTSNSVESGTASPLVAPSVVEVTGAPSFPAQPATFVKVPPLKEPLSLVDAQEIKEERAPVPQPPAIEATQRSSSEEKISTDVMEVDDPRLIAKTVAMPLVAFDIERLLLTTFLATQFGKLALGNPSLDPNRRQTLMDAQYGKCLSVSIDDGSRPPAAVLASYRYCLDRGYIETHDPVIPLTADLLLGRMEIDQYLLQRRRITGDELRDIVKVAREEGIKLTQVLVKSGYLTEADLETLAREQKRFAFK